MSNFFGFAVLILFAGGTVGGMVALSQWLGPRRTRPRSRHAFRERKDAARDHARPLLGEVLPGCPALYSVRRRADLSLSLGCGFKELGLAGFFSMLIFLAVVVAGLFYSLKKGALQWK